MSYHEYEESKELVALDFSFYALIMGAMRQADTTNAGLLAEAFPEQWRELNERYNAPGGRLAGERVSGHE